MFNKYLIESRAIQKFIIIFLTFLSYFYILKNINQLYFQINLNFLNRQYLFLATSLFLIYIILRGYFWSLLVQKDQFSIYLASQIGKFIPGKIGPSYFRSKYLDDSLINQAKLSIKEMVIFSATHIFVALIFIPNNVLFFVLSIILFFFLNKVNKTALISSLFHYLTYVFLCLSLNYQIEEVFLISSLYVVSAIIAIPINLVPLGIGIREAIFIFSYNLIGFSFEFAELIVLSRAVSIIIEVVVYSIYAVKNRGNFAK